MRMGVGVTVCVRDMTQLHVDRDSFISYMCDMTHPMSHVIDP